MAAGKTDYFRLRSRTVCARRNAQSLVMLLCLFLVVAELRANGQAPTDASPDSVSPIHATPAIADLPQSPVDLRSLPKNLLIDQKNFWSMPFHMSATQWQWTVPVGFVGAGLVASDTAIEGHVPTDPTVVSHAVTLSNAGLGIMAGVGGGMFLLGHVTHNDQQRETGLLSGEAGINALLTSELLSLAFGRERPFTGDGKGHFFQGGNSFPSHHAAIDWAIASVIAHEYPGPLTQFLAYGGAGVFSAARVVGHQHFATDVIVGSALGWYIGRQVYRTHSHYSDAEIARWGTFNKQSAVGRDTANLASINVPLDSWIYPAIERLISLGYIHSATLGMRPWTRMECARLLLDEANAQREANEQSGDGESLYKALTTEFAPEIARWNGTENLDASLDSIYTRFTGISGVPLRDSLHFGQTLINDYGRPYAEGFNDVTGLSGHTVIGPLAFYVRGEYQHTPIGAALSSEAAQVIQAVDGLPSAPPTTPVAAVNRFDVLEGYAAMQLNNWMFSFGKQALWWGPDESGPMLFSNNAEPILMLRISRVKPFQLPSIFSAIGNIRIDYLVGRLSGYRWVYSATTGFTGSWTQSLANQPFIVGQKITIKPSANLEVGISATALFAGPGVPATAHKLLQAMFSTGNGAPGSPQDPGDRRGGFDFAYRIPGLRNWLSFYADCFTDDEPNPWLSWNKTALTSGLYLSHLPKLSKLDLRVEGVYTDPPGGGKTAVHGFFYFNDRFRSGYANEESLIGSWIGRQGQGARVWTNYWFTPKSKLQLNFRHQKVSQQFISGGGTLTDFGASGDYWLRSNINLFAQIQHERWLFPVIQPNVARNLTAMLQISFVPHWSARSQP